MAHKPMGVGRRSVRLAGRDYRAGWYFITVCVQNKVCLFGDISNGQMQPNRKGSIVMEEWLELGRRYPMVRLDAWTLMPNHLHGIVGLRPLRRDTSGAQRLGARQRAPTIPGPGNRLLPATKALGGIIGAFKTATTRHINALSETTGERFWQRNYHERIIRDAKELGRIRQYIRDNPAHWDQDQENPWNT